MASSFTMHSVIPGAGAKQMASMPTSESLGAWDIVEHRGRYSGVRRVDQRLWFQSK